MDSRHTVNCEAPERDRLAPVQFPNRLQLLRAKQLRLAQRNDESGISAHREPSQSRQVQVVIMIVADHYCVDARKIPRGYAWLSPAPRTCPRKRTRSLRPH